MSYIKALIALLATLVIASPLYAESATANSDVETQVVASEEKLININSAKVRELIKIKGINSARARAIIGYRKRHGNFKSLDALAKVKGFTKMKEEQLQVIMEQLTL